MGGRARSRRGDRSRPSGQHFLRSAVIAAELVDEAGVDASDLVLEIGAGTGRLTDPLANRARVVAVELDPDLAEGLRRRFAARPEVDVVQGDILRVPLPVQPFRAFGNIPFALGTSILRRLFDDPDSPLVSADLLMQYEVVRKRVLNWPSNLLSLGWLPWWSFTMTRRLPRWCFEPAPSVDVGLLSVRRRARPLLPGDAQSDYVRLLKRAFDRASSPVRRTLRPMLPELAWKRLARDRGIPVDARPTELDVFDWVGVFGLVRSHTP